MSLSSFKLLSFDQGYFNPGLSFECANHVINNPIYSASSDHVSSVTYPATTSTECNHCGLHFEDNVNLEEHIRIYHSNNPISMTKGFPCNVCKIDFNNFTNFVSHLQQQHTCNLYPCFKCMIIYYQQEDLNVHIMSIHHSPMSSSVQPLVIENSLQTNPPLSGVNYVYTDPSNIDSQPLISAKKTFPRNKIC